MTPSSGIGVHEDGFWLSLPTIAGFRHIRSIHKPIAAKWLNGPRQYPAFEPLRPTRNDKLQTGKIEKREFVEASGCRMRHD